MQDESGFYRVRGDIIEKDCRVYRPVTTANARVSAFREWSDNSLSDGTPLSP